MSKNQAVPVRWMAPETLRFTKFSTSSDVWAYGVTIWEIYTLGDHPYFLVCNENIPQEILNGLTLDIPEQCPESIKNVMRQSWKFDPSRRCSFDEIVAYLWMNLLFPQKKLFYTFSVRFFVHTSFL